MELPTLLFPLVVGLHLLSLLVGVANLADLFDRLLSLLLRILRDLHQLLDFCSQLLVFIFEGIFEALDLLGDLLLDLVLHPVDPALDAR